MRQKKRRGDSKPTPGFPLAGSPRSLALVLGLLTFALYLPSLWSGFVYDAESQILIDNFLHEPGHFADVLTLRVLSQDVLDGNRPVQLLSLMLDSLFWKKSPVGYHLTSNLLHAGNVALLFFLMTTLLHRGTPWKKGASGPFVGLLPPLLAALVFAAHPLLVEPVAEVSCREDLLAGFFLLSAVLLALQCAGGKAPLWTGAGCLLAVLLSCGAKEAGIVTPFVILLTGLLFRRGEPFLRWLILAGSTLAVAIGFLAARFLLQPESSEVFLHEPGYLGGSLATVVKVQPRIWAFYVRAICWPSALSADYTAQNVLTIPALHAWLALAGFLALQLFTAWKSRFGVMGLALFWLGLAPVSNVIPIFRPVADRYLYLPLMGVAFTLCGLLVLAAGHRRLYPVATGGVVCALLALLPQTLQRQNVFANSLNLWRDAVRKSPWSETAANNLAYAYLEEDQLPEALNAFQKTLNLTSGKKANAWAGAAVALEKLGRPADARAALDKAIALEKMYSDPQKLKRSLVVNAEQLAVIEQILRRP